MSEENKTGARMPDMSQVLVSPGPHIHAKETVPRFMFTVAAALLPACLAGVWFFGLAALQVLLLCTLSCVAIEEGWNRLVGRRPTWKDGSAVVTGILLGMNLNAGVPWWVCVLGGLLAIVLAKQLYGGLGYNPFNPALVARVGLLIGLPEIMTTWNPTRFMNVDGLTTATPLGMAPGAAQAGDMLVGNIGGCLGETSAVALLAGGAVLVAFRLVKWQLPLAYVGTVFAVTGIAHWADPAQYHSPVVHVLAGGLLLGAFFMATDMVTSPMTAKGAWIFGLGCGIITSAIRLWGAYPEGVSFSILFMNALTPLIDRLTVKKPFGYAALADGGTEP